MKPMLLATLLIATLVSTLNGEDSLQSSKFSSIALEWKPAENTAKLAAGMFVMPIQCGRSAPILRALALDPQKGQPNMNVLLGMEGDNPTVIDIGKANSVKDAHLQSYFATSTEIAALVSGADEIAIEKKRVQVTPRPGSAEPTREFEQSRNTAETHKYILHFSFDGTLKNTSRLDDSFDVRVLGEFQSGKFLFGGMREGKPQWAVADEDGAIRALVTLPDENKVREDSAKSFKLDGFNGPIAAASMFDLTQPVPYRESLVIALPADDAPLYVINQGGGVRKLKLHLPPEVHKFNAIPSESGFYIRDNDNENDKVKGATNSGGYIYRIDLETGEVLQKYDAGEIPVSSVVCVDENGFIALHSDKGVTSLLRGSAK